MDFIIAMLIAWMGMGPVSEVVGGINHPGQRASDTVKETAPSVVPDRRDPGRNHGPIIIIDDTHFKRHKEQ